jgi:hypothetical protein
MEVLIGILGAVQRFISGVMHLRPGWRPRWVGYFTVAVAVLMLGGIGWTAWRAPPEWSFAQADRERLGRALRGYSGRFPVYFFPVESSAAANDYAEKLLMVFRSEGWAETKIVHLKTVRSDMEGLGLVSSSRTFDSLALPGS